MRRNPHARDPYVRGSVALLAFSVALAAHAAGPDPAQFADYVPAAAVIKCPYVPEGLQSIPTCGGKLATCIGTDGHDLILGSEEDDVIAALGGRNVVHGDAGNDTICGGPEGDSLFGARGDDTIYGEGGSDWLFGAPGADKLRGGEGDFDVLWGGPGFDDLDGGPGDNDVCLLQREMGAYTDECNTVYPPPGYVHEQEPEPGILKLPKKK